MTYDLDMFDPILYLTSKLLVIDIVSAQLWC